MIGEFGEALVLDWGIATNLTEVPEAAGTPGFMAPEQAMGDVPVDARVDVHGLGAILRTRTGTKPVYISVGHRVDLPSALALVMACTPKYRLPEPIRQAHNAAGAF